MLSDGSAGRPLPGLSPAYAACLWLIWASLLML
uniref:Uncharacterized protein n=1 Tax=Sinorhizobium meliloti (strain SM11) TaxID=707241 RepID=A4KVJ4_SINMM|nr:hypothetical protein [Sinorhizobium meliloti SM11]